MATVLEVCKGVCSELSIDPPTSLVTGQNETGNKMKVMAASLGEELRNELLWSELIRYTTITLQTGVDSYALPNDFDSWAFNTVWNNTLGKPLRLVRDPQRWQFVKNSITTDSNLYQKYRVKGISTKQLFIDPVPTSTENGQVLSFEYYTKSIFSPQGWATSTQYLAGSYVNYNGNYYKTASGGTSGDSPPVHTTTTPVSDKGTSSNSGVSWTYQDLSYDKILTDNDEFILDETLFKSGLKYKFCLGSSLAYDKYEKIYEQQKKLIISNRKGLEDIVRTSIYGSDIPVPTLPDLVGG